MEIDIIAVDAAAEPVDDLERAGRVLRGDVDGVDYGAATVGAERVGGVDGAAELQRE